MDLGDLHARGLLELLDVELAKALAGGGGIAEPEVALAIALTSRNVRRGHTCLPIGLSASELWPGEPALDTALPKRDAWAEVLRSSRLTQEGPLVLDGRGRLYLRRYWQLEKDVAEELARRAAVQDDGATDSPWIAEALERLFPGEPDSPQRRAARNALRHDVSLLCGGPGTGKTTTIAAITALIIERALHERGTAPEVMLLAPTGKAAARLGEAVRSAKGRIAAAKEVLERIPTEAKTVHRALGLQRGGVRFWRNADRPLEADVIVLDEASMVDLALMRQLLVAAPPNATLLIVGDPDQLTPVEAGSVLRDLVTADANTWWRGRITTLTQTYRYDETRPLGRLVAAIRQGDGSTIATLLSEAAGEDVAWAPLADLPSELERAAQHWSAALHPDAREAHFELRRRYVMLTPFRKGRIGTVRLGAAIQDRLAVTAASKPRITPIIIEENSRELDIYNGDFAMLIDDGNEMTALVQSDGQPRELAEARLPRYSDAYALSVHKAQGSEFDEVLIVLPEEDAPLLTRELLYTAVSRARQKVRIVGPTDVVLAALARRARRDSGLVDAIAEAEHLVVRAE